MIASLHTIFQGIQSLWHSIPSAVWAMLYALWIIISIIFMLGQRRPPTATLSWIFGFIALPVLSVAFYFLFGPRKLKRRNIRRELARHLAARHGHPRQQQRLPETLANRHWLRAQARVAMEAGCPPPRSGQTVKVLIDGDATYTAIEAAMQAARHHIHLEYYIFEPDAIGTRWRDLLADKARAGVKVRMLVDAVGSPRCRGPRFWQPLLDAGGEVRVFNPPRLVPFRPSMVNFRTHRKIVVVDGLHGFTGGINIDQVESAAESGSEAWRDTHLAVSGTATMDLQRLFLEDWLYAGARSGQLARLDKALTTPQDIQAWFPLPPAEESVDVGQTWVQVIDSGPDRNESAIHRFLFTAMASARYRIWVTTPYFVPDEAILMAMTTAAARGVDVRLLVPMESDQLLTGLAASTFVEEALLKRVRVYAYVPRFIHAKTMVVDDELSVIGTANMDNRSFRLNFEVMAAIYDQPTTAAMASQFLKDLESSTQLHPDYQPDSFSQRLVASLARLAAPLL
ncbi:MAG: cardiolipin synthase [Lautropia sp.]|nr:cardiolipin synthase [Lautropia sp.]